MISCDVDQIIIRSIWVTRAALKFFSVAKLKNGTETDLAILGAYQIGKAEIQVCELDLENQDAMNNIQDHLLQKTGGQTVPRIFIDGNFVGGADDLQKLNQTGELKLLLSKARVLQQDL